MVVSVLGLTAEVTGDSVAAQKHMEGLRRMVDLRGGLEMLRFDNSRLPAKVCRLVPFPIDKISLIDRISDMMKH